MPQEDSLLTRQHSKMVNNTWILFSRLQKCLWSLISSSLLLLKSRFAFSGVLGSLGSFRALKTDSLPQEDVAGKLRIPSFQVQTVMRWSLTHESWVNRKSGGQTRNREEILCLNAKLWVPFFPFCYYFLLCATLFCTFISPPLIFVCFTACLCEPLSAHVPVLWPKWNDSCCVSERWKNDSVIEALKGRIRERHDSVGKWKWQMASNFREKQQWMP